jgi:hypothetical protein
MIYMPRQIILIKGFKPANKPVMNPSIYRNTIIPEDEYE